MKKTQEWDWPPERQFRATFSAEATPTIIPRKPSIGTRIANGYWRFMVTLFKLVVAAICTAVLFGCIWFISVLVSK